MLRNIRRIIPVRGYSQYCISGVGIPASAKHLLKQNIPYSSIKITEDQLIVCPTCYRVGSTLFEDRFLFINSFRTSVTGYFLNDVIFRNFDDFNHDIHMLSTEEIKQNIENLKRYLPKISIREFYGNSMKRSIYTGTHNPDIDLDSDAPIQSLVDNYVIGIE